MMVPPRFVGYGAMLVLAAIGAGPMRAPARKPQKSAKASSNRKALLLEKALRRQERQAR